jgi:DNA-binding GntR family transcriptional regulator
LARTDIRLRTAHNEMVDILSTTAVGDRLPSEPALAERLKVSRTIVRSILQSFEAAGIVHLNGREKTVLRKPTADDRIEKGLEYLSMEELESRFLDWILRFDVPANTPLNVAQLAKQFSVPIHSLQEFLARLSNFGLVERRPRGGWLMLGFTTDYALELSEFRTLLEMNAIDALVGLPEGHDIWKRLDRLEEDHLSLLERIDHDYHDFSKLDGRFHADLNSVVTNRFVIEFQKVISLIFHYHYQWDKREERQRNTNAIGEHLRIIRALRNRDQPEAKRAALAHLATSKETLVASLRSNNLVEWA